MSETAAVLAALVPSLPEATRLELKRMLDAELTLPAAAVVRQRRLGVLLDFLGAYGVPPSQTQYTAFRADCADEGLPAATLGDQYGGWERAVQAAVKLFERGTGGRVPAAARPAGPGVAVLPYRHADVTSAIDATRDFLGDWPSQEAFWITVDCWRRLGHLPPGVARLPTRKPLKRLFGTYAEALLAAQRQEQLRASPAEAHTSGEERAGAGRREYRRRSRQAR